MGILKNGRVGRLRREKCQRIRILKTVGLADFAEKNAKRMGMECNAEEMRIRMLLFDRAN